MELRAHVCRAPTSLAYIFLQVSSVELLAFQQCTQKCTSFWYRHEAPLAVKIHDFLEGGKPSSQWPGMQTFEATGRTSLKSSHRTRMCGTFRLYILWPRWGEFQASLLNHHAKRILSSGLRQRAGTVAGVLRGTFTASSSRARGRQSWNFAGVCRSGSRPSTVSICC